MTVHGRVKGAAGYCPFLMIVLTGEITGPGTNEIKKFSARILIDRRPGTEISRARFGKFGRGRQLPCDAVEYSRMIPKSVTRKLRAESISVDVGSEVISCKDFVFRRCLRVMADAGSRSTSRRRIKRLIRRITLRYGRSRHCTGVSLLQGILSLSLLVRMRSPHRVTLIRPCPSRWRG